MAQLHVQGGYPLKGLIKISGAKNAALPLMAASILTADPVHLQNMPKISDIDTMADILKSYGVYVVAKQEGLVLCADAMHRIPSYPELANKIRASFLVLGPLVARIGQATVYSPGGCKLNQCARPVDLHELALKALGAEVKKFSSQYGEGFKVSVPGGRLHGAQIKFDKVSVGATETALMAACLAQGTTVIENAAMNPDVTDLANMLEKMGAQIEGTGTNRLEIRGVERLHGVKHNVVPDRIEAGTYAVAAMITRGDLELDLGGANNVVILKAVLEKLKEAGAKVTATETGIRVTGSARPHPVDIITQPFPGFPTDMQPQWMALMSLADGDSIIEDNIFDQRIKHVDHLKTMGAKIVEIVSQSANKAMKVTGIDFSELNSDQEVTATDLRAAAALVLIAMATKGKTTIRDIYHLERGYEDVVDKLTKCGGRLKKDDMPESA